MTLSSTLARNAANKGPALPVAEARIRPARPDAERFLLASSSALLLAAASSLNLFLWSTALEMAMAPPRAAAAPAPRVVASVPTEAAMASTSMSGRLIFGSSRGDGWTGALGAGRALSTASRL